MKLLGPLVVVNRYKILEKKAVDRYQWECFEYKKEKKYKGDEYVNEMRLQSQFFIYIKNCD